MNIFKEKKVCIVGAGRVGTTMAAVIANLRAPDLILKTVYSLHEESLKRAARYIGANSSSVLFTRKISECTEGSNCIFICTPDDVIEKACNNVINTGFSDFSGKLFAHFSGAKPLNVLSRALDVNAFIASMHPIKSFASIENSIKTMQGTIFGVTFQKNCPEDIKKVILYIIHDLGGQSVEVVDELKSLYHASACVASNYLVALINYAVKIHERIGIAPEESLKGLMGLIEGTIDNIKKLGTKKALTGPIARGDVGTIKEHIKNFNAQFEEKDISTYKVLGRETSSIAYENGWIDSDTYKEFEKIFILNRSLKD